MIGGECAWDLWTRTHSHTRSLLRPRLSRTDFPSPVKWSLVTIHCLRCSEIAAPPSVVEQIFDLPALADVYQVTEAFIGCRPASVQVDGTSLESISRTLQRHIYEFAYASAASIEGHLRRLHSIAAVLRPDNAERQAMFVADCCSRGPPRSVARELIRLCV